MLVEVPVLEMRPISECILGTGKCPFCDEIFVKFTKLTSKTGKDFEIRREGYLWLLTKEEVEAYKRTNNQMWSTRSCRKILVTGRNG